MDERVATVTVSVVFPVFPVTGSMAVIVMGPPTVNAVASPLEPAALLMDAITEGFGVVVQVTDDVRFCVVASEYIPVAINCCVVPLAILGLTGVTPMDDRVAAVTVNVVLPEISPDVAVIVMGPPTVNAVASPLEPAALLMDATGEGFGVVVQVTDNVRSCVVASE